jgi:hypothetical protein
VLLLLQVPPPVASFNAVVCPWHTISVPVTGAAGLTVTTAVTWQPETPEGVKTMDDVPPDTPVTVPSEATVATDVLPLVQAPLPAASVNDSVLPGHTGVFVPLIGVALITVTVTIL